MTRIRAIISGGGTGGHIFPAVAIARQLLSTDSQNGILFVGAKGKMEMEKVPAAGFGIVGLPISGLQRQLTPRNIIGDILVPFKFIASIIKAGKVIRKFKPDIAIGVGGYASAPLLFAATRLGIPTLIQEQNGFAGLTNRLLSKRVDRICVAYGNMERFFPKDKIVLTGNPIRPEIRPATGQTRAEGISFYNLDPSRRHLLIIGGSLGSRTLNESVEKWISDGCPGGEGIEVLWQCGRYYKDSVDAFMSAHKDATSIHYSDFIARMDLAYAAADVVISRSGASSVSEICAARKASVLVPSPNVAEDHQTHNAMALVDAGAALMVRDSDARSSLMSTAISLITNPADAGEIARKAGDLASQNAAASIVEEIYRILGHNV